MGPVTIAVDSYGPVTDNAQSIYELSLIETIPNVEKEIEKDFGFKPDFEKAKHYLEENDSAGNTFKATAKPVLIGTAVVGATTMIFSLILFSGRLSDVEPENDPQPAQSLTRCSGFLCGGAVIYWFTGASMQAVTTGAYRAVEYIKKNIKLDDKASLSASTENSKEVVKICTQYAQKGMFNIFIAIFCFALAFAFFSAPVRATAQSVILLRQLPDLDCRVRSLPGHLHGQCRRLLGQCQEGRRSRPEGKGNAAARRRRSSATPSATPSRTPPRSP